MKNMNYRLIYFNFRPETRFKDTDIGRIPEDWKVVRLGEIFNVYAGGDAKSFNISPYKSAKFKYPVYSNAIESRGLYGYSDIYKYPENSITITARGTLGYAIPRFEKFNAIIRLLVLVPKHPVDIIFVANYINHFVKFDREKTSIPQLTIPRVKGHKIPLPPLDEQRAIAQVLLSFDELLQTIDKQIENLERIKKGMMEVYFTRGVFEHDRFKDTDIGRIPEGWEVVRLGEVVEESSETVDNSSLANADKLPVLSLTKRFGLILQQERFGKRVATEDISKYKVVRKGQIVYNPFVIWEGAIHILKNFDYGLVSPVYIVISPKPSVNSYFLDIWLRTPMAINAYNRFATGAVNRRRAIKKKDFFSITIPLPPLEEQRAIAQRLREVDELIENRRKMREHVERAKRGVMDALLSGKVRVKMEVENEGQG